MTGPDTPKNASIRDAVTLLAEHRLNDIFTLRLATRYVVTNSEHSTAAVFGSTGPLPGTVSTFPRYNFHLHQDFNEFSILPSTEARFATGPVRHAVLAGIEASSISDVGNILYAPVALIDLLASTYGVHVQPPATTKGQDNRYSTVSGFVQEQADWERLHAPFALRGTGLDVVAGAGAYATTSQAIDLSLPDRTPGFATFDTSVSWQRGPLRLPHRRRPFLRGSP